jgi:RHS repeat-associated protein
MVRVTFSSPGWSIAHQGLIVDAESGLVYVRRQYLNALLGRWHARDSAGYWIGGNLYEYLLSIPNRLLDPFGYQATLPSTRPAIPPLPYSAPAGGGCQIRTVCHPPTSHCGIYVSSNGLVMAVDGAGQFKGLTLGLVPDVQSAPSPSLLQQILTAVANDPSVNTSGINGPPPEGPGFPPAQIWGRPAGPWPTDPWYTPKSLFGPWMPQPQKACDCLTNWNNQKAWNSVNVTPYHTKSTNSDWALKCYLGACGIKLTWPVDTPIGWDDPTPCPTCKFPANPSGQGG